jgi:ADP-ribose pyrophosphatase YjhB (NUDIX family)
MIKNYCPGYFDAVSGGVVSAGESYETNAYREIGEEMGIHGVPMSHLFTFLYEVCNK